MSKVKIALTTGDVDGIGLEVTAKALNILGPQKNTQLWMFRSGQADKRYLKLIDKKWSLIVVDSAEEASKIEGSYLIDIDSEASPAQWVEDAAKLCLSGELQAMATAPLSKTSIKAAGFKDLGHTDILKRLSKSKFVNMGFAGEHFNVVLATGHIPVAQISKALDIKTVSAALWNTNELRKKLPASQAKLPVGVLGLNPHAGEEGLIGREEVALFAKLKAFAKQNKIPMSGPLVPDAAFLKANWKRYSVFLALYHDQGLIPFKAIHGQDSGVHMTLGIPFVRTSVDHGTAKDIFGQNKANPHSMLDAIRWAIKLARL